MMNEKIRKLLALFILVLFSGLVKGQEVYTNGIGMEFVFIQPGTMTVGKFEPTVGEFGTGSRLPVTTYERAKRMAKEACRSGFLVTIDQPYYIGKFEVTQEQWVKVMGKNPSVFQGNKVAERTDHHPVDNISWKDAQAFVKKLNALDRSHHYRLPTEFEWEYAARAGAEDDISWADIQASAVLGGAHPSAVGQKKPNAWGLYDMLGNVWEWTQDHYNEKLFADPVPPKSGKEHVLKGASFVGDVKNATYMTHAAGPGNGYDIGLRIVMVRK